MADNLGTSVSTEEIDIDSMFPGLNFTDVKPVKNVFSAEKPEVDLDQLKLEEDPIDPLPPKVEALKNIPEKVDSTVINSIDGDLDPLKQDFEDAKQGTPSELRDFIKSKIESGELVPFDDYDDKSSLDDYLKGFKKKDYDELLKVNLEAKEAALNESVPREFFSMLSPELQQAAKYELEGGTDLKGLFASLARVQQTKSLNIETDAEQIATDYLTATNYGTPEEIEEQVNEWKDLNKIKEKAKVFQPKLVKLDEEFTQSKVAEQTRRDQHRQAQYEEYHNNVVDAVKDLDLKGLKITKQQQLEIYNGLTQATVVDKQGKKNTDFNALMQKIMYDEPDFKLLSKIYLLMKDEKGFEEKVGTKATNTNVEQTARALKTEQSRKIGGQAGQQSEIPDSTPKKTLPRTSSRLFSR